MAKVNPKQGLRSDQGIIELPDPFDLDQDGLIDPGLLPAGLSATSLFAITSAQDATGTIDGSPVLTVDGATGNVGAGTTNPLRKLHVEGAGLTAVRVKASSTGAAAVELIPSNNDSLRVWLQVHQTTGALDILNNAGTRLGYVQQTGEWGIGGIPTNGNRFQVGTTATSTALTVYDDDGSTTVNRGHLAGSVFAVGADGGLTPFYVSKATAVVRIPVDVAGALRIGAGDDLRLWHDGTDSHVYSYTGPLQVGTGATEDVVFRVNDTSVGRFDQSVNSAFVVGPNAAQSGAKLDIQTTGQAHALYVADADGTLHLPWDAGSSGAPNIAIGAGDDLRFYHDGTDSYVYNNNGGLQMFQSANAEMRFRCNSASGGDITFYTRGANLRCSITGNGLNLNPVASAPVTPVNGDIWITTGGALQFRANGTTYTVTAT